MVLTVIIASAALPSAGGVHDALELTARDKMVLARVRDGSRTVDENGFYLMMARVAAIEPLEPGRGTQLDAPAVKNLTRDADRYRYQPIRLKVRVFYVRKRSVEAGTISANPYWPAERAIWEIHCLNAEPPTLAEQEDQPIIICTPAPPPGLPRPSEIDLKGAKQYAAGPRYDVAGVFYKYVEKSDIGDEQGRPKLRKYPVVLAWRMDRASVPAELDWGDKFLGGAILLGLGLGISAFLFLKRRIRRNEQQRLDRPTFKKYHPLRDKPDAPAGEEQDNAPVDLS